MCLNAYISPLCQVISVRLFLPRCLNFAIPTTSRDKSRCSVEVVAGSVSQRSRLPDFTLAGDLVTQQVVRVQIETNSAFLRSTHTPRAPFNSATVPLLQKKKIAGVLFFLSCTDGIGLELLSSHSFAHKVCQCNSFSWTNQRDRNFMMKKCCLKGSRRGT